MSSNRMLLMFAASIPLFGIASCALKGGGSSATSGSEYTAAILLIDHSKSVDDAMFRVRHAELFLASISGPGEYTAFLIEDNPMAMRPVASIVLPPLDPVKETPGRYQKTIKRSLSREIPSAADAIRAALKQPPSKFTAIIDATEAAARQFRLSRIKPTRKLLVILSDMLEDSAGIEFAKASTIAGSSSRVTLIERLNREGRIPALEGTEVIVAGARSDPKIPRLHFDRVEDFWCQFFGKAGAHVLRDTFSPTLQEPLLRRLMGAKE